jgi:hypothetical protein
MTEKIGVVDPKQKLIARLHYFRDEHSEKIPQRIILSIDKKKNYKVRTVWFSGLAGDLENAMTKGVIKPEIKAEVDKFFDWYTTDFRSRPGNMRNTMKDIERGNKVINAVLESLGDTTK